MSDIVNPHDLVRTYVESPEALAIAPVFIMWRTGSGRHITAWQVHHAYGRATAPREERDSYRDHGRKTFTVFSTANKRAALRRAIDWTIEHYTFPVEQDDPAAWQGVRAGGQLAYVPPAVADWWRQQRKAASRA